MGKGEVADTTRFLLAFIVIVALLVSAANGFRRQGSGDAVLIIVILLALAASGLYRLVGDVIMMGVLK